MSDRKHIKIALDEVYRVARQIEEQSRNDHIQELASVIGDLAAICEELLMDIEALEDSGG